jgi:hypothetical protein
MDCRAALPPSPKLRRAGAMTEVEEGRWSCWNDGYDGDEVAGGNKFRAVYCLLLKLRRDEGRELGEAYSC